MLTSENKRKIDIIGGKLEYTKKKASKSITLLIKFIGKVEDKT